MILDFGFSFLDFERRFLILEYNISGLSSIDNLETVIETIKEFKKDEMISFNSHNLELILGAAVAKFLELDKRVINYGEIQTINGLKEIFYDEAEQKESFGFVYREQSCERVVENRRLFVFIPSVVSSLFYHSADGRISSDAVEVLAALIVKVGFSSFNPRDIAPVDEEAADEHQFVYYGLMHKLMNEPLLTDDKQRTGLTLAARNRNLSAIKLADYIPARFCDKGVLAGKPFSHKANIQALRDSEIDVSRQSLTTSVGYSIDETKDFLNKLKGESWNYENVITQAYSEEVYKEVRDFIEKIRGFDYTRDENMNSFNHRDGFKEAFATHSCTVKRLKVHRRGAAWTTGFRATNFYFEKLSNIKLEALKEVFKEATVEEALDDIENPDKFLANATSLNFSVASVEDSVDFLSE